MAQEQFGVTHVRPSWWPPPEETNAKLEAKFLPQPSGSAPQYSQIHEPSGTPIRYLKGVHDGNNFTEVPDEEIVKGYEYAKVQHVLIDPKEIDQLKLEAKQTIDMVRFVDVDEIEPAIGRSPIT
jgi:non-homologous end joining protein Ku